MQLTSPVFTHAVTHAAADVAASRARFLPVFFITLGVLLLWAQSASARDLHGRIGLGYNAQFANQRTGSGVPGLGIKYAMTRDLALEGIIGAETGSGSQSTFGAKLFKNVFFENNLNFYAFFAGAALKSGNRSGYDIQAGFGSEFFIPGIDSIGMSFEVGGEATNISGSTVVRTLGLSFLHAGMRFYF
ncbi:MAG: hypothetical protein EOP09_20450 [Proteobacteria bacterium]|nr:MAG: hypothetical protein EOP09_20450 [Pseudomonadota bacterium]